MKFHHKMGLTGHMKTKLCKRITNKHKQEQIIVQSFKYIITEYDEFTGKTNNSNEIIYNTWDQCYEQFIVQRKVDSTHHIVAVL